LACVWSLSCASDLPVGDVEFSSGEFNQDFAREDVLILSPRVVDFTSVIFQTEWTLEFDEVDKVLASILEELVEVVGSVQLIDGSVSGLCAGVEENIISVVNSARAHMEDQVADSESSVCINFRVTSIDTEDQSNGWSRVNEL